MSPSEDDLLTPAGDEREPPTVLAVSARAPGEAPVVLIAFASPAPRPHPTVTIEIPSVSASGNEVNEVVDVRYVIANECLQPSV
jgi:hypothetical protein